MSIVKDYIEECRVVPGNKVRLKNYDSGWAGDKKIPKEDRKKYAEEELAKSVGELAKAQELLYAADAWSVLMVFQALDAAGKDGTIKHVMSGINPQGCQVYSFKHPSTEELDHNFLWRCMKVLPERGRIGIFNRSYYEEVLIAKVHPEIVAAQHIPDAKTNDKFWQGRYDDINNFERHLVRNGTIIMKFFLHLSREEQRRRFLDRLNDPNKHWKFSPSDLKEREYWDQYQTAYEEALEATSTKWAPWYIIPADNKWVSRALVARILTTGIDGLELKFPEVSPALQEQITAAKKQLAAE